MDRMGLNNTELKAYKRALAAPHPLRVSVTLCNLDEDPLESITPIVLSGQVTVDATAEVSRMLEMEFLDPHHDLNVDTARPSDGAIAFDRIIKVYYSIWVDELDRWVTCQVFTGWAPKLSRDGAVIRVEAYGKEKLLQRPAWRTFHRGKDANRVNTLRAFLRERSGEERFDFPEGTKDTLGDPFDVGRTQIIWPRARHLRGNRQLFYTGRGLCTLRKLPSSPVMTFRPGDGGLLLPGLQVDTDAEGLKNTAHVKGKKHLDPVVVQIKRGPVSPRRLSRNDVPGVFAVFESNPHYKTKKQMHERGERILDKQSREVVTPSYNIIPVPNLHELDMVKVVDLKGTPIRHRMVKWALPLVAEGAPPMTVNYTRRLVPRRAKIRR